MLHVLCATLVLAVALLETTLIRQWAQQHVLVEQAAAGAPLQFQYPARN